MLLFKPLVVPNQHAISSCLSAIACCFLIALVIRRTFSESSRVDPYKCDALRTKGQWVYDQPVQSTLSDSGRWQFPGCMIHAYSRHDIEQCLEHKAIIFVGDSTARRLFWASASKINATKAQALKMTVQKHNDATFEHKDTKLQFLWDPYLNGSTHASWLGLDLNSYAPWNGTSTAAVIFSGGLWHARHMRDQYLSVFRSHVRSLTKLLSNDPRRIMYDARLPPAYRSQPNRTPIFLPIIQPNTTGLDGSRSRTLTGERLDLMNQFLQEEGVSGRIELFQNFAAMAQDHPYAFACDGVHASDHLTSLQANLLLNFLCNSQAILQKMPHDKTCCNVAPANDLRTYLLVACVIILLLIVANVQSRWLCAVCQFFKDDSSATSLMLLSLAIVYCFAADRSSLFEKIDRPVNLTAFMVFSVLGLMAGFATRSGSPTELSTPDKSTIIPSHQSLFLPRQQSEEWKGWMQLLILLYHYFGMSKILWVYCVARLLVASYLFMTGFGHTIYFLNTQDFSLHRVAVVLLRLNILSCILGYVMLTSYDFYYFSILSSFWFAVVFCTLGIGFRSNHSVSGIIARCLLSMSLVKGFVQVPGLLEGLSTVLSVLFRASFHAREFRFRTGLDLYIVYVGVLVGWLYHERRYAALYTSLVSSSKRSDTLLWMVDNKGLLSPSLRGVCAIVLFGYLLLVGCLADKYQYNRLHPWTSPIFVLAFIALRNSSRRLQDFHSPLFAWLGRCSLETYILQCHIWLAGDAKGLLRLGIWNKHRAGDLMEKMIITVFFFWTSWHVSKATNTLVTVALGPKSTTSSCILAGRLIIFCLALVVVNWLLEVPSRDLSFRCR